MSLCLMLCLSVSGHVLRRHTVQRCWHNLINIVLVTEHHGSLLLVHFLVIKKHFKGPHYGYEREAVTLVQILEIIDV